MRVIVTGGRGFLGGHIVAALRERGHEVCAPRSGDYDLRNRQACAALLADHHGADAVVHAAAAVGGIGANAAEPGRFFYDNAIMGIQLMELARLAGVGKFVSIGTACEYPEHAAVPFNEDEIWDGYPTPVTAPYALAKKMLLVQGQAYREQYGFNAVHLIPTNLYGPGDNFNPETGHVIAGLIVKFSKAARDNEPTVAGWGSGKATRDFLYVDDAAASIITATEVYDGALPLNLGSGVERPIYDIADAIAGIYGYDGDVVWDSSHPSGQPRRALDTTRAEQELGHVARTPFHEGLEKTVQWFEVRQ